MRHNNLCRRSAPLFRDQFQGAALRDGRCKRISDTTPLHGRLLGRCFAQDAPSRSRVGASCLCGIRRGGLAGGISPQGRAKRCTISFERHATSLRDTPAKEDHRVNWEPGKKLRDTGFYVTKESAEVSIRLQRGQTGTGTCNRGSIICALPAARVSKAARPTSIRASAEPRKPRPPWIGSKPHLAPDVSGWHGPRSSECSRASGSPRASCAPRRRGGPTLLTNLRFFDGSTLAMQTGRDILIDGGRIVALPAAGTGPEDADVIDCGGRAVTPGLIDCHWHATLVSVSQVAALTQDIAFVHLVAGQEAGATLMRGFTTVRDTGGPVFGLKMAIDRGVVTGPRIFPSGAMISQTSGHGDFRLLSTLPRADGDLDYTETTGLAAIADGEVEVLRRTREQLMKGASQIKIMAGGGVTSIYDPLDTAQYFEEEMRAAVRAAADWGTYVCAHVYTPEGIQRSLRAGVKSIEHGQLADLESVRMMRDEGAWWSIQPFLQDEDSNPRSNPIQQQKAEEVARGTVQAFEMGRSEGVNMAFGTDILLNPGASRSQGRQLAKLTRFMSPLETLRMATAMPVSFWRCRGRAIPMPGALASSPKGRMPTSWCGTATRRPTVDLPTNLKTAKTFAYSQRAARCSRRRCNANRFLVRPCAAMRDLNGKILGIYYILK